MTYKPYQSVGFFVAQIDQNHTFCYTVYMVAMVLLQRRSKMVTVRTKGRPGVRFYTISNNDNNVDIVPNEWAITKRFRLNPDTLSDTPYNPDFYREMIRAGSIEGAKIQNWDPADGVGIRTIQTMLHLQTNYNQLLMRGFYRQPLSVVEGALRQWYDEIADNFPAYARFCTAEYERHIRRYEQGLGQDFRFVA
jgi:hypothetical protein